ncbi:MAG: hypothetical protein V4525_14255 [Pseudomonadota bacterium]
MFKNLKIVSSIIILSLVSGCATRTPYGGEPPARGQNANLKTIRYQPTKWNIPIVGYLIPNSSFLIMDMRKEPGQGAAIASALTGGLGALVIATSIQQSVSASAPKDKVQLVDLKNITDQALASKIQSDPRYSWVHLNDNAQPSYILTPRAIITIQKDNKIAVTVKIEAERKDKSGNTIWKNLYEGFNSVGEKELTGQEGWLSHNGMYLNQAAEHGIETAVTNFLNATSKN